MTIIRSLCCWLAILSTASFYPALAESPDVCNDEERNEHSVLCRMMDRLQDPSEAERLVAEIRQFSHEAGLMVEPVESVLDDETQVVASKRKLQGDSSDGIPVVMAHGMGDSCFNSGMQSLTKYASQLLGGVYGTCIPTGDRLHEDTMNGYFLSMDKNVENFAAKVKADPKLAQGFYGIGLSQGNNVIRGYISNYNDPPVLRFISINGVNAGVGAVPYCIPKEANQLSLAAQNMCDLLMEQASKRAYSDFAQKHSFQANYWRDPRPVEKEAYQTYSQLARWNNEVPQVNETLKENWKKTEKFVWVMAEDDEMVWPKEGEHWGAPDPKDPFNRILPMNETEWYQKDLFGLKTAQEAGKNVFESFPGDHLRFADDDFKRWVQTYLK